MRRFEVPASWNVPTFQCKMLFGVFVFEDETKVGRIGELASSSTDVYLRRRCSGKVVVVVEEVMLVLVNDDE